MATESDWTGHEGELDALAQQDQPWEQIGRILTGYEEDHNDIKRRLAGDYSDYSGLMTKPTEPWTVEHANEHAKAEALRIVRLLINDGYVRLDDVIAE